jgi:streptomycin 6-kinase
VSDVVLPPAWVDQVAGYPPDGGPSGADWVRTVPGLLETGLQRWGLRVDGAPRTGWTAVVVPVRRDGEALALKVTWPHPEGRLEHLALRVWDGDGAVRLVAAHPADGLLLLERLDPDDDLSSVWADEACEVIGSLLARLGVPAPPQVVDLADYLPEQLGRMAARPAVPRRVVTRTTGLARELLADPGPRRLLHTDLHFENVLRAPDGRRLAIDPKPLAGHPGFEIFPVLRNRVAEMGSGAGFRWSVRHRLSLVAEAAGIDEDEARAWTLLRAGIETSWATLEGGESLTTCVALTKALDD